MHQNLWLCDWVQLRSADANDNASQVRAFEEMQADPNVKPDVACINAMVDALQRLGDMAAAESYLPEAARLAQEQGKPHSRCLSFSLACLCGGFSQRRVGIPPVKTAVLQIHLSIVVWA